MQTLELFKSPAIAVATMTLFGALLTAIKSWLELNDEHLLKRPFKKLAFLENECQKSETLSHVITVARNEEAFRTIIGRTVTPEFMTAIATLLSTNKFTILELRTSINYLKLENGSILVELGRAAWFSFWLPLIYIVSMGAYAGTLIFTLLLNKPNSTSLISAAILAIIYLFFSWLVGKDAKAVYFSDKLKSKIEALKQDKI
jgi:hypothetical protein